MLDEMNKCVAPIHKQASQAFCVLSNLLSKAIGRPFGGWAMSANFPSLILTKSWVSCWGVTTNGGWYSSPGVPLRLVDVPPLAMLPLLCTPAADRFVPLWGVSVWKAVRADPSYPSSLYLSQSV